MDPSTSEQTANKRHSASPPQPSSSFIANPTSDATSSSNATFDNISSEPLHSIASFTAANINAISSSVSSLSSSSSSSSFSSSRSHNTRTTKIKSTKFTTDTPATTTSPTKPLQFINKVAPVIQRPAETFGPYVQSESAIRQKVRKQIREEGKIKRYSNCFIKYRTEMHPLIVGRYGHQNNKEISRLAGIWWRNEPEEVKRIYRQQAQDEKLKHATIYPNYKYTPVKVASKSESSGLEEGSEKVPEVMEGAQPDNQNGYTSTSTEKPEGTEPVEGKEKPKEKQSKKYVVTETPLHAFVGDTEGAEPLKKTLHKQWNESSRRLDLPLDSLVSPENEFVLLTQDPSDMASSLVYNNLTLQAFDEQVMGFVPQGNVLSFDQISNGGVVNDASCFSLANPVYSEQWKTPSISMSPPLDVDLSMSQPTTIDMASMTASISTSEHMTSVRPSSYLAIQTEPQLGHMSIVRLIEVLPQPLPQQVPSTPPIAPSLAYADQEFPWHLGFVDSSSLMQTHPTMSPVDTRAPDESMLTSVSRPMSIPVIESHLTGHPFNLTMDPSSAPGMPSIVHFDGNVGHSMAKDSFLANLGASDGTWAQGASACGHSTSIPTSGTPLPSTESSQVMQKFSFTLIPDEWITDKIPEVQLKSSNQLTDQQQQHHRRHDLYLPSGRNGSLDLCSPQHLQPQQEGLPSITLQRPEGGLPNAGEEELRVSISYLEQLVQQHKMQLNFQQQQRLATQHFQQ
ncbi:hypothetical protein CPC16_004800 [Podila verticillata]|nr:hypothetical protein CPC16_004800 [Podila verticillata]